MRSSTQRDYEERILRVLVHIQGHLDETLSLKDLASLAHFSPYHFHRVFRGMVGEPLKEHVRRLRLERAAYLLKTTDRPVTDVAFGAGYETHEAFTRAFRTQFSETPSGFRAQRRSAPSWAAGSLVHFQPDGQVPALPGADDGEPTMDARLEEMTPMDVAFVRHVGPYPEVGAAWQKLMGWAFSKGVFRGGQLLAVVHDDPDITPPERLRYDACMAAPEGFEGEGEIGVQRVAGGPYAVALHRGPYERLGETYGQLMGRWIPSNDREPAHAPCLEVYLNNPQQTAPEDLLTEVWIPLLPA